MYWLVEDESQLNVLINSSYKKAFIEVIPFSNVIHPAQTHVSLVYIRPLEATKGFMVCIAHSESLNAFSSFYSYAPLTFVEAVGNLFSLPKRTAGGSLSSRGLVYVHNFGNYGMYYDATSGAEFNIQVIVNGGIQNTKIFDKYFFLNFGKIVLLISVKIFILFN